ncbi:hypothetical protein Lepto7375DRAFT_3417 [Leptolyngbya sp. PCC 7375]|nr:hypothetical protein Lepto7375DRAFT_3417 [Leptolyngbya sp. PCC 7375]
MPIFEITKEHIKQLTDTDLRTLLGLLCEAELRTNTYPTSSVLWGGHQNANDGGLDVEVNLKDQLSKLDYIPRPHTGYQAKQEKMPASKIKKEMLKGRQLRPVIRQLIAESGAYIIASGIDDCSSSMLQDRLKAMREAIAEEDQASNLHVDFYDSNRIATWVRNHPSIILWVRRKVGQPLDGWYPYGNWANASESTASQYLLDDRARLHDVRHPNKEGMRTVDGIQRLRQLLNTPQEVIRLTGLSGVGKTRFVQALFESQVSEAALAPSLAIYTDISFSPEPSVRKMVEILVAQGQRAIVIIDNCPPDVHRSLAKVVMQKGCQLSLLTIEYDVIGDEPEDTAVFKLESSDQRLIEKLVRIRHSHISQIDAETIAAFSDGNARVALALASTARNGESLSKLNDGELLKRLFGRPENQEENLLDAAETLSLVYSYDGETTDEETSELSLLGSLVDASVSQMYRFSAALCRKDLVQKRGPWRAVLPHALANRLAEQALENISPEIVLKKFRSYGYERLLRSFSRRLGYLHTSPKAQAIVKFWLSNGYFFDDALQVNEQNVNIFRNIAPVAPEMALEVIERAVDKNEAFLTHRSLSHQRFSELLCKIAYDSQLFQRSVNLLIQFTKAENNKTSYSSGSETLCVVCFGSVCQGHMLL